MAPPASSPALPLRARLEGLLARLCLSLPRPLLRLIIRLLGGRPTVIDGNRLDEQAQLTLLLERLVDPTPVSALTVEQARANVEKNAHVLSPRAGPVRVEALSVAGGAGARGARLYVPPGLPGHGAPGLVFFHGGGFVVGSLDSHDALCRALAERARCAVVSVDYRLAPEHLFPAAVDDAIAAFADVAARAERLGLDGARLAIGGDSAGGNLAAVAALALRGQARGPAFQLLLYPVVDAACTFPSMETFREGFFLDRETIDWYTARYLPPGTDPCDPRASPLYAEEVAGAAPALVVTAGFDPLRDEGAAYAERLRADGVAAEYRCYGSLFHGFLNTAGAIDAADRALDEISAALAAALAATRAAPALSAPVPGSRPSAA